ncbi:DUF3027 domain-containing protein [Bifidobacterium pullorum subsp. gallinarum]|uniref:DUF3027 domain-containing protein n=1 Tax=Bifidobacterium pullorum subsp. gallinarum TaxID=78344 RepID=A0A4P6DU89_9BIFI|nr:DUF3027 domain-containing protein [Bifidobacterium pullorum]QAY33266.1 DUF3027 domain-containing protein [Bifidobacterium pullorum subsp. gallinarum]
MSDMMLDPQTIARSVARAMADDPDQVGAFVEAIDMGDGVTDFRFATEYRGYEGWQWSVTLFHDEELDRWTVNESSLVPTDQALRPPEWVPWKDRLEPTDLSVTDSIGTDPDDPRLEEGFRRTRAVGEQAQPEDGADDAAAVPASDEVASSEDMPTPSDVAAGEGSDSEVAATAQSDVDDAVEEFDLSRRHVMSPLGRSQTAKRWYEGPRGPKSLSTKTAGGHTCATCGFFVPLKGELNLLFGVCANKWSPDDGRVVSLDHGCGEHSEIEPPEPTHLWVQSKPAFDDLHIDIIAHAPREESPEVELIERINDRDEDEATDEDIDANVTAEDDVDETEETGVTAEQPQVEETIDLSGDVVPSAEHADDEPDGSDTERSETESADARDAAGESGSQTDTSVRVEPEPESESDDSADPDDSTAQNA